MKRYERHADAIAQLIHSGALRPGDRVPSVREASRTRGISPSTVFEAYYLLEAQGLIHARPRSGYYVSAQLPGTAEARPAEPQPSQPAVTSTEVAISDLVFEVLGLARDRDLVPLGSAFPGLELFPLERLARCLASGMRKLDPWNIVQSLPPGDERLRQQIALRYGVHGTAVDVEEIIITNGAMEALNLCLQTVTQPGDLVAIESPAFYATLQVLERLKLKAVEIPVHPREGIDLGVLAERLANLPIKACWFMSSLQNPMGATLGEAQKAELYALLKRHQVPLIEDDVYAELHYGAQPPRPLKSFDDAGLVMHCGSFSKSLAPGYRVGWVAGGRFAEQIARLKLMTTISPSVPAQAAIADYLQHGGYDRHLRKLRIALETQQAAMLASAARHFPAETRVSRPAGGYFLWFEFPERVDSLQLFQLALAQGISLAPGPIFSATRGFRHCARLNHGHPWDAQSEQAMVALGRILATL